MTAIKDAKLLIDSQKYSEVTQVFTSNIDEDLLDATNRTDILITDVANAPGTQGNDDFYSLNQVVEVQVFYSVDFEDDFDEFEVKLLKLFKKNNWNFYNTNNARTTDPDTFQATGTFYFSRQKYIN